MKLFLWESLELRNGTAGAFAMAETKEGAIEILCGTTKNITGDKLFCDQEPEPELRKQLEEFEPITIENERGGFIFME